MDSNWLKLQELFRTFFRTAHLELKKELQIGDFEGWDSLSHFELMVTIEETFAVNFTLDEMSAMNDVGDLYTSLLSKINQPAP
jgi:acyl carrier protein